MHLILISPEASLELLEEGKKKKRQTHTVEKNRMGSHSHERRPVVTNLAGLKSKAAVGRPSASDLHSRLPKTKRLAVLGPSAVGEGSAKIRPGGGARQESVRFLDLPPISCPYPSTLQNNWKIILGLREIRYSLRTWVCGIEK